MEESMAKALLNFKRNGGVIFNSEQPFCAQT